MKRRGLSWWEGQKSRRLTGPDAAVLALLMLLAAAAIAGGAVTRRTLEPEIAAKVATTLERSRLPVRMPDARLRTVEDQHTTLRRVQAGRLAVVTMINPRAPFVALFLERLLKDYHDDGALVVVVPSMVEAEQAHQDLVDVGMGDLVFYRDARNAILRTGPIHVLPTTFLVAPSGRILDRVVGKDAEQLARLQYRYRLERELPE